MNTISSLIGLSCYIRTPSLTDRQMTRNIMAARTGKPVEYKGIEGPLVQVHTVYCVLNAHGQSSMDSSIVRGWALVV